MFLLKKIISHFLYPLPLSVLIMLTALALLWGTRKQKAAKMLLSLGLLLLLVCSYDPLPASMMRGLESQFTPLAGQGQSNPDKMQGLPSKMRIVVLGGFHVADPRLPATGQLSENSLARVVEGIRLYRALTPSTLIFSGALVHGGKLHGDVMAAAARELGVPAADIRVSGSAQDTASEARVFQPLLGHESFVLVTSASHMPRAVALFTKLEMQPIPAPTDYQEKHNAGTRRRHAGTFFPSPTQLRRSTSALHEYLGMLWAKLTGQA